MNESSQERLLLDTEPVALDRSKYESLIMQTAMSTNCSEEEAWATVKAHLEEALAQGQNTGGRRKVVAPALAKAEEPVARVTPSSDSAGIETTRQVDAPTRAVTMRERRRPEFERQPDGRLLLKLNGSPVSSVTADDLPHELRIAGQSLMEQLSLGMVTLEGEHPDAELLRSAAPAGIFDVGFTNDPVRQAAIAAIHQKQYQYPFQRDTVRILPTDFSKTSLFHVASNNTARRYCRDEMLGKVGDSTRIEYRGEELRHDDEMVFMQLLHVARGKRPFEAMHFNTAHFFRGSRGTGRILGAKDTASVSESLRRMRAGILVVTNTTTGKYFTLNVVKDLKGSTVDQTVMMDPVVVLLCSSFAAMDTDQLFSTSGVARQLFKYISTIPTSVSQLHPIKVTNLFELCYGTIESLENHYRESHPGVADAKVKIAISKKVSDFRRKNLPAALHSLKDDSVIVDFEIDPTTDKVAITRNPAAAPSVIEGPSQNEAS